MRHHVWDVGQRRRRWELAVAGRGRRRRGSGRDVGPRGGRRLAPERLQRRRRRHARRSSLQGCRRGGRRRSATFPRLREPRHGRDVGHRDAHIRRGGSHVRLARARGKAVGRATARPQPARVHRVRLATGGAHGDGRRRRPSGVLRCLPERRRLTNGLERGGLLQRGLGRRPRRRGVPGRRHRRHRGEVVRRPRARVLRRLLERRDDDVSARV